MKLGLKSRRSWQGVSKAIAHCCRLDLNARRVWRARIAANWRYLFLVIGLFVITSLLLQVEFRLLPIVAGRIRSSLPYPLMQMALIPVNSNNAIVFASLEDRSARSWALVVMACNRPWYLEPVLKSVLRLPKDDLSKVDVIVSQDGHDQGVRQVVQQYSKLVRHWERDRPDSSQLVDNLARASSHRRVAEWANRCRHRP